jgi:hypothetical protein
MIPDSQITVLACSDGELRDIDACHGHYLKSDLISVCKCSEIRNNFENATYQRPQPPQQCPQEGSNLRTPLRRPCAVMLAHLS